MGGGVQGERIFLIHADPNSEGLGWGLLAQNPRQGLERLFGT